MGKLELGVEDFAYSEGVRVNGKTTVRRTTTGQVASILEDRYHVMGTFFGLKQEKIATYLADSVADAIAALFRGQNPGRPTYGAEQQIEAAFRAFLDANEMDTIARALTGMGISGAASRGVNRRKLHPFSQKNAARPAFIDTGTYRAAFRAKVKM